MEPPFRSWSLYFPDKSNHLFNFKLITISSVFHPHDEVASLAIRFLSLFRQNSYLLNFVPFQGGGDLVDTAKSCVNVRVDTLKESLGSIDLFERQLDTAPELLLSIIGMAASEILYTNQPIGANQIKLAVRLFSDGPVHPFRDLKAFQIGKFITIQGTVVRISSIRPLPIRLAFQCSKCLQVTVISTPDGIFRQPTKCQTNHCLSKKFSLQRDSPETCCVNWQRVKIQELLELSSGTDDEGRIPRILDAELALDLVDVIRPGEIVKMSGILKTLDSLQIDRALNFNNNSGSMIYLDVISIEKNIQYDSSVSSLISNQEIISLSRSKNLLSTLVQSFCPQIYGNEMVKFGLLLGLVGGSKKAGHNPGSISIRPDPHILLVGDPGLGKSQLLNFATIIAPRSVYICANTSTAVGLTATVQDGGLEAGALVLADQGCCFIDEFDKISGDGWRSLLDVMEQQTINIAKAGIVCSLPARTSIIAAANPVGGHYNKSKSVVNNLKMDNALLSRFDLVFILLDKPNSDMDKALSEHVLGNLRGLEQFRKASIFTSQAPPPSLLLKGTASLNERLLERNEKIMSEKYLKQYIGYARQNITPKLTTEASSVLQEFYLELRKSRNVDENLPITTRHLESLIRLSEARAKLELRTLVTCEDAIDVVELFKFCTSDTMEKPMVKSNGKKGTKSGALKRFASELVKISSRTGEIEFQKVQLQALFDTLSITEVSFTELLDALNENGYILKKSTGYRLLVT